MGLYGTNAEDAPAGTESVLVIYNFHIFQINDTYLFRIILSILFRLMK